LIKEQGKTSKTLRATELGVSRQSLYYKPKKPDKDWWLKCRIEEVLRTPGKHSYGSRRIAWDLHLNRKRVKRVMKIFGIKPYRRRGRKWLSSKKIEHIFPNLLLTGYPTCRDKIWVSDFTLIRYYEKKAYLCTVMDLWNREIVGLAVLTNHSVQLVLNAFLSALHNHSRPEIFHSDNGSEYDSKVFVQMLIEFNVKISRSKPGCPWENGYQESFYDKFKIDLGDPNRFDSLGELIYNIYHQVHFYNHTRIHTALKTSPIQFSIFAQNAKIQSQN
jgi:putative transposase